MTSRRLVWITFPIILLVAIYFLGPQPEKPAYNLTIPSVPDEPDALEQYIASLESKHKVKPGNDAEIVWVDSARRKTHYAVLYLHGFSASKTEGDPVHKKFARTFGCNLFLPRLSDHGVDTTESLLQFTADRAWESAKIALAIAEKLGEKIIIMSTSTGSTLGLKLAAEYPERVHALVNLSPNIGLRDGAAFMLNDPWGLYIARAVMGGKYYKTDATPEQARVWNESYRLESLVQLEELVETSMTRETFSKIRQPSLTLYYYRSESEQDPTVSIDAMLTMNDQLGTPPDLKVMHALPNAGAHAIASSLKSKDVDGVYRAIEQFAIDKLGMSKMN